MRGEDWKLSTSIAKRAQTTAFTGKQFRPAQLKLTHVHGCASRIAAVVDRVGDDPVDSDLNVFNQVCRLKIPLIVDKQDQSDQRQLSPGRKLWQAGVGSQSTGPLRIPQPGIAKLRELAHVGNGRVSAAR